MMTPVEQLRHPRETEIALKKFLASHRFEAASVDRDGGMPRSLFDPLILQLHTVKGSTAANDVIVQLLSWDFISGKTSWDQPEIGCQLVHEWSFQRSEYDSGTCLWLIVDPRAEFEVNARQLIWDTRRTGYPGWFPPGLFLGDDRTIT